MKPRTFNSKIRSTIKLMLIKTISFSIAFLIGIILIPVTLIVSARRYIDREKRSPFECGFDPFKLARFPFSLHFFLLTVIFLVFDVEIVLLFPLPFFLISSNIKVLTVIIFFIVILIYGLFHEWNEGSLNWIN